MHRLAKIVCAGAIACGGVLVAPSSVLAQAYPGGITEERKPDPGDPGDVLGEAEERPAQVQGVQAERGALAVTGGDILQLTLLGGGLVVGGSVLVRRSRRSAPAPA